MNNTTVRVGRVMRGGRQKMVAVCRLESDSVADRAPIAKKFQVEETDTVAVALHLNLDVRVLAVEVVNEREEFVH
jgi:hypothetical protein